MKYWVQNKTEFSDIREHERMLSDEMRMSAYFKMVSDNVSKDDVVLDLGTGTGVLSAWCAARCKYVYGIEHVPKLVRISQQLAASNNLNNVEFFCGHSTAFSAPQTASVLIHEQIGAELFDEHIIPNIVDIRDRCLRRDAKILPRILRLHLVPIKFISSDWFPLLWNIRVKNLDYSQLKEALDTPFEHARVRVPSSSVIPLGEPLEGPTVIDLKTIDLKQFPISIERSFEVHSSTHIDGVGIWFDAGMDETPLFGNGPLWLQKPWPIAVERIEPISVIQNELVSLKAYLSGTSIDNVCLKTSMPNEKK